MALSPRNFEVPARRPHLDRGWGLALSADTHMSSHPYPGRLEIGCGSASPPLFSEPGRAVQHDMPCRHKQRDRSPRKGLPGDPSWQFQPAPTHLACRRLSVSQLLAPVDGGRERPSLPSVGEAFAHPFHGCLLSLLTPRPVLGAGSPVALWQEGEGMLQYATR